MDIEQTIKERRSVRRYEVRKVEEEKLRKVLEAGRLAPSAHNAQDWKFIVVKEEERRKRLASAAANQNFVGEAPIVIAAVALNPEEMMSCGVPAYAVDLAIAVEHIVLQAAALGLGTCWIGAFEQERVKEILNIPADCKVVALLPLGYPADKPQPKSRKSLKEIICLEEFK